MSTNYKFHNPEGLYFITFSTVRWIDIFTRRIYKDIIVDSLNYCIAHKGLELFAWVIMSNHVHLIARTNDKPLSNIIRDLKRHTSKQLLKTIEESTQESRKDWLLWMFSQAGKYNPNNEHYQLWQQDNHQIELWSNDVMDQKLNYIHNNPVAAGWVDLPEHYLYSSARSYAGETGLINISLLI